MTMNSLFRSVIGAVSRYCALQREMAERETALMQRAEDQFRDRRDAEPPPSPTTTIWDEWEKRHSH
jgi:hypothetical protein